MLKSKRQFLFAIIIMSITLLSTFIVVHAGELVITGALTINSPHWQRPLAPGDNGLGFRTRGDCTHGGVQQDRIPYATYALRVTEAGPYHFNLRAANVGSDLHLILYNGNPPFTANGNTGCIANIDDSFVGSCCPQMNIQLETDVTYTIVVTTFDEDEYGAYTLTISGPGDVVQSTYFADGRLNFLDAATPIVVYPTSDGGINVYSDTGVSLFTVSATVLNIGGTCPGENTTLATYDNPSIIVTRLTNCEIQINAAMYNGKTYVLIFLDFGGGYTSYEIE